MTARIEVVGVDLALIDQAIPWWVYMRHKDKPDTALWWKVTPTSCECEGFGYRDECRHQSKAAERWREWFPNPGATVAVDIPSNGWTSWESVLGTREIPVDSAQVIKEAVRCMVDRDEVSAKAPWLAVEYLAADYLAAKRSG